jgi:hypothetical protein
MQDTGERHARADTNVYRVSGALVIWLVGFEQGYLIQSLAQPHHNPPDAARSYKKI